MNAADRRLAARELGLKMFPPGGGITATLNLDDLVAAVGAIDDEMDKLPATLNAGLTVKQNLVGALPEPFESESTAVQKALALGLWAMKEAGQI
jgi:hypothetical protein